jgi:methionyl-tRNA synthetase
VARKQDPARLGTIVTTLAEVLEAASVMVAPVMPTVAAGLRAQLGLDPLAPTVGEDRWPLELPTRAPGRAVAKGEPLFPRMEKEHVAAIRKDFSPAMEAPAEEAHEESGKATIAFDDFSKIDLRVGVVLRAERIKRKDKLLSLAIDTGDGEPRSLVAGIAQSYAPEELVGRRVVVLCNLAARKFGKGLVSEGMVLAADAGDGVKLLTVDGELSPGAQIR